MQDIINNANYFDLAVVIFLAISGFMSYHKGFTREITSILKWATAFFFAIYNIDLVRPYLVEYFPEDKLLLNLFSAVILFVLTLLLLSIILQLISIKLEHNPFSGIDGVLGFIYGIVKAMVVLAVLFMISFRFYNSWPNVIKDSKSIVYIQKTAHLIDDLLPNDFDIGQTADKITDKAMSAIK